MTCNGKVGQPRIRFNETARRVAKHKSDTKYQRNRRQKEKQSESITPTKVGIDVNGVNNIALNSESTIPVYDIRRQNGNSKYLLSNDAISITDIENILKNNVTDIFG